MRLEWAEEAFCANTMALLLADLRSTGTLLAENSWQESPPKGGEDGRTGAGAELHQIQSKASPN